MTAATSGSGMTPARAACEAYDRDLFGDCGHDEDIWATRGDRERHAWEAAAQAVLNDAFPRLRRDRRRAGLPQARGGTVSGSITVGGEDLGSDPYEAILRLRRERDQLREKLAAAEHFADIWKDTLPELPDAYMCTYTCAEANAAADLYRALGDEDTAAAIIAAHAAYDEDGDEHYREQP